MIRSVYMINKEGDPLYGRTFEDGAYSDLAALPSLVRNSVAMMWSSSSISSERVYMLEMDVDVWAYIFFPSFALIAPAPKEEPVTQLKNLMQSLGKAIAHDFADIIKSWNGSMSDIADIDALIDNYLSVDLNRPSPKIVKFIERLIDKTLKNPEIAFVGVFDAEGDLLKGNVPEVYIFRIQVEIAQGAISPVIDIAPSVIRSGDHVLQMLKVYSLTTVAASQPNESNLYAISAVSEMANALYDKMS